MKISPLGKFLLTLSVLSLLTIPVISGVSIGNSFYGEDDSEMMSQGPPDDRGPPGDERGPPEPGEMGRKLGHIENRRGSFLSFETFDGGIENYSLAFAEDLQVFEQVDVEDFEIKEERERGVHSDVIGNDSKFRTYDNPSVQMKLDVEGEGRNVSFRLGEMEIGETTDRIINMAHGNFSARLMLVAGTNRTVSEPEIEDEVINYTVEEEARFLFRLGRKDLDGVGLSEFVDEGISQGKIGAEMRVEAVNEDEYAEQEITYQDVNLEPRLENQDKLEMEVSSETLGEEGTVLLLDVASSVMDIEEIEEVEIDFDGEPAKHVEDLEELTEADEPAYSLFIGEEDAFILFRVPYFSTHTITVEHITEAVEDFIGSLRYYLPSAGLTAGLVLFGVLYRQYDENDKGKKKDKKNKQKYNKKKKKVVSLAGDPEKFEEDLGKESEKRIKSGKKEKEDKEQTKVRKD